MDFIRIGKITGAHGIHGRLKVFVVSDIESRFEAGKKVLLGLPAGETEYRISEVIAARDRIILLGLEGIADRNAAHALRGVEIFIDGSEAERTRKDLGDDAFYYHDLVGCEVFRDGTKFGEVMDILEAGGGEVLVIRNLGGKNLLVPFVRGMVDTADIDKGRITISPVEGLFDI